MQRRAFLWCGAGLLGLGAALPAWAEEACAGFKWEVRRELALFSGVAEPVSAAREVSAAPVIAVGTLYEAALPPQEEVRFAAPPSKKMLVDGASGGVMRFRVPKAGRYRVALSRGFWVDVVDGSQLVSSIDFGGVPGCEAPRKIVIYELPEGRDLVLQLGAGIESTIRVAVVPESGR